MVTVAPVGPPPFFPARRGGGAGRTGRDGASLRLGNAGTPPLPPLTCAGRPGCPRPLAAMQETNAFLLSALQPEAGVCSLALPSDRQLDERGREAAEAQRLRSARVQEQVRIRMMLRGQAPARPDDLADGTRGGRTPRDPLGTRGGAGGGSPSAGTGLWAHPGCGLGGAPHPDRVPRASPALGPGAAEPQRGLVSPHSGSCLSSPTALGGHCAGGVACPALGWQWGGFSRSGIAPPALSGSAGRAPAPPFNVCAGGLRPAAPPGTAGIPRAATPVLGTPAVGTDPL